MPYSGPGDKNLPKHIKQLTRHQREVFVAAFNSAYEAKLAETKDSSKAESYAFAVATAAAKKAPKKAPKETKAMKAMKEMKFTAVVPFLKAWEEGGKRFIAMLASSDTTDKASERVVPEFIAKMREDAEAGNIALLENHSDVIPIARSSGVIEGSEVWDAAVAKGCTASGPEAIFVPKFELDEEHPLADKVFKAVSSEECDWQCSIGGRAVAKKVFDKASGGIVQELWPGSIDHVALTRNGGACNPDTMMFGAVMKSEEWEEVEEPEDTEKATEDNVRQRINAALSERYPSENDGLYSPWLQTLESVPSEGYCIIYRDGKNYRVHYVVGENGVTFGNEEEVEQVWQTKKDAPSLDAVAAQMSTTFDAVLAKLQADAITPEQVREIIREEMAKAGEGAGESSEETTEETQEDKNQEDSKEDEQESTKEAEAQQEPEKANTSDEASTAFSRIAALFADFNAKVQAIITPPVLEAAKDAPATESVVEKGGDTQKSGESEIDTLKARVAALETENEALKKSPDPKATMPVSGTRVHEAERIIGDGTPSESDEVAKAIEAVSASRGLGNRAEFDAKEAAQRAIAGLVSQM